MLAAALATATALALAAEPRGSGAQPPDFVLGVGAGAGSQAAGLWVDLTLRSSHLVGGVRGGALLLREDAGGELGVTLGVAFASPPGPQVEVLVDVGRAYFSRDSRANDRALDVVYGEETSGSSATLPFAQVRVGGAVRLGGGQRLFTFGAYARAVERRDVVYTSRGCTLLGLACLPAQTETARYGGNSVGVYIGLAYVVRLPRASPAPVAPAPLAPAPPAAAPWDGAPAPTSNAPPPEPSPSAPAPQPEPPRSE